jgi:thioredoxin reductase (NADPH)
MSDDLLNKKDIYDVIIIGGGPAGLTAGMYLSRARVSVLLIEKLSIGGQVTLTDKIENYPGFTEGISGPGLVHAMDEQAKSYGMKTAFGEVAKIECGKGTDTKKVFVDGESEPYQCLSIIIAAGHQQRKLGISGEEEYAGRGVSYCATCDGAFFRDLPIALIGGGDAAIEEALFLTRFVQKVYIIHRRDRLRATKVLQERALGNKKIEVIYDSAVDEIFGQATVDGVKAKNLKTGEKSNLDVKGVFVFIGWNPNLSFLGDQIETSADGYIVVDKEMATSKEGVFACGDCCKKNLKQIVTACGDGATAAFSAQHYIDRIKGQEYI